MMAKKWFVFVCVSLFFLAFASFVSSFANPTPGFNNPTSSGFFGGNSYQSYQPSFTQLYRGSSGTIGLSELWPALRNLEGDQCQAATDFVIGISPAGCQPLVVRSDLLAEQPVPVFCELYAIKVNPLIKTSAIKHISFRGQTPDGVAGISFHPARAAVRSYSTLLGDPLINNIGYVVIVLEQQVNESEIIDEVAGMLTATIHYDADLAYGTGRAEYYAPVLSQDEWDRQFNRYSFWQGRGYVRVTGVDGNSATVQVLSGKDQVLQTLVLQEGQTSDLLYMPGFYCSAGLKVRLNRLETPEDSALINIDGSDLWVRQGSKILDNACTVTRLELDGKRTGLFGTIRDDDYVAQVNPSGSVRISCPGSTLDLSLSRREEVVVDAVSLHQDADESVDAALVDVSLSSSRLSSFVAANQTTENLIALYPFEDKGGDLGTYGEEVLFEQILLAERTGQYASSSALMKLFLDTYGSSYLVDDLLVRQQRLGTFDYRDALGTVLVNGRYHTIGLHELHDSGVDNKTVDVGVLGHGRISNLQEGDRINLSGDGSEYLQVRTIDPRRVTVTYRNADRDARTRSDSETIFEGQRATIGPGVEVSVERIDAEELAFISLIPEVKHTRTDANFTFRIGVEKRGLELSPEKTRRLLANVNESIDQFENINEKLGTVVSGWKAACFATSTLLTVKSMATSFDGTALARQKVMQHYKALCDREFGRENRDLCYSEKAGEIEREVEVMQQAMSSVNARMQSAQEGVTREGDLFGDASITDQDQYLGQLKSQVSDDWSFTLNDQRITKADLETTAQIRAALLDEQFVGKTGPAADAARDEVEGSLRNVALAVSQRQQADATSQQISSQWGLEVPGNKIAVLPVDNALTLRWSGEFASAYKLPLEQGVDPDTARVQAMQLPGSPDTPVLALLSSPAGTLSDQTMLVRKVYVRQQGVWSEVSNAAELGLDTSRVVFSGAGLGIGQHGKCSHPWPTGTAEVVYYESGQNRGLPAIVPFDTTDGWYVMVPNAGGSFIEDTPQGYQASGDVSYMKICNIGADGVMGSGTGDDICQTFSVNTADQVESFGGCPGLTSEEVGRLYTSAREAIRQASSQAGSSSVTIFGQQMSVGDPRSTIGGFECQDFMSVDDCKIMFNACDPVICPSSRCDLGGKYPVQDVIQTGIIGSIALCLPNAAEGIYVPICLSGIHAGLDAYISVLKSEQQCLQHALDTGQYVGICDEITAVYKCEFFWRQLSPLLNIALPKAVKGLVGGGAVRGGGEYLLVQSAFDNLDRSVNFFKNTYAQNTFRAFELRNTQEAGSMFCQAFIGSSFPTSASALDSLLAPDSPHQFYAEFDEFPFTEATVPATSQYKVFYHIFAGNDVGTQYRVYLKNPPASSYYQSTPVIHVKTGFVARGSQATESLDFTAPAGYKELCVAIGTQEECGFRKVSTNFAVDYLESKYVEDQAETTDISTEKECIAGSPSLYSLANLNLQAGVQETIDPDISLRGIVRVCATHNPGQNVDSGSARWVDVGHCGDPSLRCWLDRDSVEEDLERVAAVEGVTLDAAQRQLDHLQTTKKSFEDTEVILSRIRQEVRSLSLEGLDASSKVIDLIFELDALVGTGDSPGSGSNNQKAEALALKAALYRFLVDQDRTQVVTVEIAPRPTTVEQGVDSDGVGVAGVDSFPSPDPVDPVVEDSEVEDIFWKDEMEAYVDVSSGLVILSDDTSLSGIFGDRVLVEGEVVRFVTFETLEGQRKYYVRDGDLSNPFSFSLFRVYDDGSSITLGDGDDEDGVDSGSGSVPDSSEDEVPEGFGLEQDSFYENDFTLTYNGEVTDYYIDAEQRKVFDVDGLEVGSLDNFGGIDIIFEPERALIIQEDGIVFRLTDIEAFIFDSPRLISKAKAKELEESALVESKVWSVRSVKNTDDEVVFSGSADFEDFIHYKGEKTHVYISGYLPESKSASLDFAQPWGDLDVGSVKQGFFVDIDAKFDDKNVGDFKNLNAEGKIPFSTKLEGLRYDGQKIYLPRWWHEE